MIDLSISANALAHGVHYAVVGVGVLGLLALLTPQFLGTRAPRDDHERRVQLLGEQIHAGALGSTLTTFPVVLAPRSAPLPPRDRRAALLLPVAVISSAAAAGAHAAVGPAHFSEKAVFGLFFVCSALVQISWAVVMVLRPSRPLLELAVIGNLAAVALWVLTRTVGLGSLLPTPEPIGPWDLCCVVWELAVVLCCSRLVRSQHRGDVLLRIPAWPGWSTPARAWAIGSVLTLGVLTLSGAGA